MLPETSHKAKEATDKLGFFLLLEAAMLYSMPSQRDPGNDHNALLTLSNGQ